MDQNNNQTVVNSSQDAELQNRRDAVRKLGKFAAYAAPFTVLATNLKADAGTGSGGGPSAASGKSAAARRH